MTERGSVSGKAGQRRSPRRRAAPPTPDALHPTPDPPNRTGRIKDGTACTWAYDAIYRLTEQKKSGQAATFSYDDAGNILVKAHEGSNPYSFTYDVANRLVTSIQGASQLTTFTHDNNGNLTGERCDTLGTLLTWVYDNENRCLNELKPSGANHTYSYAENGLRWSSQMGGSVHVHNSIWVDDDVINDYIDGAPSARYDVVDGEVLAIKQGANRYVYVPDPLGSVNHLLDTSLNKAATYVYFPYGELQANTGAGSNRQFVGALGYVTLTTNRLYVRAREYRPDLGRWQTEDPIGFEGGDLNLFAYAAFGPTGTVDPSGLKPCYGSYLQSCQTACGKFGVASCTVNWYIRIRDCIRTSEPKVACKCKWLGECGYWKDRCLNDAQLALNMCLMSAAAGAAACLGACIMRGAPRFVCERGCAALGALLGSSCYALNHAAVRDCLDLNRECERLGAQPGGQRRGRP